MWVMQNTEGKEENDDDARRVTPMVLVAMFLLLPGVGWATYVGTSPLVPPDDGVYLHPGNVHTSYSGTNLAIVLSRAEHRGFTNVHRDPTGAGTRETFDSVVDGDVSINGGQLISVSLSGPVIVELGGGYQPGALGTFNTEMTQLNLVGGGVMIRESPTLQSLGQTTIQNIGGGLFQINSFFDIFTELSLDGGQTWLPSVGPPTHMDLTNVPEPSTWLLFGSALAIGAGLRRRFAGKRA